MKKYPIAALLSIVSLGHCYSFIIKPKAGLRISQLNLESKHNQLQPVLEINNPIYNYKDETKAANSFFFNEEGKRGTISKNNIDGTLLTQGIIGVQLSADTESERPYSSFHFSPIASIYCVADDQRQYTVQADRFNITPLPTIGAGVGLEMSSNGSYLQLGIGGEYFRCEYEGGILFSTLAKVSSAGKDEIVDTSSLIDTNEKPYIEKGTPFFMPYVYGEIETEIGDIASCFIKASYGLGVSPLLDDAKKTLELFSKDPSSYALNSHWVMHSASVGVKIRLEDLL